MKSVLIAAVLFASMAPSSGMAQDTTRTARKVEKTLTTLGDSTRKIRRDSVRLLFARDSVLRFRRDTVHWTISLDSIRQGAVRFDTAVVAWRQRDTVRGSLSGRGRSSGPAVSQNGNTGFAQHLFPPELVMQHQSRLKLTEQQRNAIVQEINRLQATAVNVQWRVADESEKLSELLSQDAVEETAALEQVNKVIEYETAVKRAQLSMLIRIRNVLTPEQRNILRGIQRTR